MAMATQSRIRELSLQIGATAESLDAYHVEHGLAGPTLQAGVTDVPYDEKYERLQIAMAAATDELQALVSGPTAFIRRMTFGQYDLVALQAAVELGIFHAVPLSGSIKVAELAKKINLDEDRTGSVVKMLATRHIFAEPSQDSISHTAVSYLLATDEDAHSFLQLQVDEMAKAGTETARCLQKNPLESSGLHSPFGTRFGQPLFSFMQENPRNAERFARGMAGFTKINNPPFYLREQYPWASLGNATVVDCGGGNGHISRALAKEFPNLRFVVQDSSVAMLDQGRASLTADLGGRVTFMTHNYLDAQPVHDAGAYLIRQCVHNCNDADAATVLRAFVPALEKRPPGTPLLVNELVLPDANTLTKVEEAHLRQLDICMLVGLGAKERSRKQWETLLAQADKRLKLVKIHGTGRLGVLEIHLQQG